MSKKWYDLVIEMVDGVKDDAVKYAPEILGVTGITLGGVTSYLAYKKRKDVEEILDMVEEAKEEDIEVPGMVVGVDIAKTMAPVFVTGMTALVCLYSSYKIQHNRIVGLTGALSIVTGQLNSFREKYKQIHGVKKAQEFFAPVEKKEITELDSKGKEKQVIKDVKISSNWMDGIWWNASEQSVSDDNDYNKQMIDTITSGLVLENFNRALTVNKVLAAYDCELVRGGGDYGWLAQDFTVDVTVVNFYDEVKEEYTKDFYIHWPIPTYLLTSAEAKSEMQQDLSVY